jgi:uncharacterized protein (DUF427 family)
VKVAVDEPINEGGIHMKAIWNGAVIAESADTVVVEGNHYFPLSSVDATRLESSSHTSVCPWKGTANYYSILVNGDRNANAAWYYANPKEAASQIKGRVAFWKGVTVAP